MCAHARADQIALSEGMEHPVVGSMRLASKQGDPNANVFVYGLPAQRWTLSWAPP